ncbi:MAG TPA: hypothetical protein VEB22_00340 [Phycisphaerales bacterium]|nr:hypothetical protein [Phycisphaerales bacterium]
MRLISRHIWRAFPELDRFSDDHCRRFTRAARRSRPAWLMLVHWAAQWAVLAVCVASGVAAASMVHGATIDWGRSLTVTYVWITVSGVVFLLLSAWGAPAWLALSHVFLRRRIAWVLRARGRCGACGYVLAGLPVDGACRVVCPECGLEVEVDPSLGELSESPAGGRARYSPSAEAMKRARPWVDLAFIRRWGGRLLAAVFAVAFAVTAAWGIYEWRLSRQAARARGMPRAAALLASLVASQRAPESDALTVTERLATVRRKLGEAHAAAFPVGLPPNVAPDGSYIAAFQKPSADFAAEWAVNEEHASAMLAALNTNGFFQELSGLTTARIEPTYAAVQGEPLWEGAALRGAEFRSLARWNAAQLRVAWRSNNVAEFEARLRTGLGLAALLERLPSLDERLNSWALESLALFDVRCVIEAHPNAAWLDAIDRAMAAHPLGTLPALPYEGERAVVRDIVAWMFSEPSRVRWGARTTELRRGLAAHRMAVGRVGTLEANLAAVDNYFDSVAARAAQPMWKRDPAPEGMGADRGLLVDLAAYRVEALLPWHDSQVVVRDGVSVMVALERYRLDRGEYPVSLAELVGSRLSAIPLDPATGKPLLYKRLVPADRHGRGYLLYSAGADGVDNGGDGGPSPWENLRPGRGRGYDYIVNDAPR